MTTEDGDQRLPHFPTRREVTVTVRREVASFRGGRSLPRGPFSGWARSGLRGPQICLTWFARAFRSNATRLPRAAQLKIKQ